VKSLFAKWAVGNVVSVTINLNSTYNNGNE
jgi:hypothetical protein